MFSVWSCRLSSTVLGDASTLFVANVYVPQLRVITSLSSIRHAIGLLLTMLHAVHESAIRQLSQEK